MIWEHDLDEILKGYYESDKSYNCVVCNKSFNKRQIYSIQDNLYDALGAIEHHFKEQHGNMAEYLLNQELNVTGLSDIQRKLLGLLLEKKSDKEIGKELGVAQSTVRNHRFKLREREKQAKMFLALMNSLEEETNKPIEKSDAGKLEEVPSSATMVDYRYNFTDKEYEKTIAAYMDKNGALKQFPSKAKKKIIILSEIIKNFKVDIEYSESEVNRTLKRIYEEDYVSIRRALIEYGFMDRSDDCSVYRVREQ